jgi:hypothetical protein
VNVDKTFSLDEAARALYYQKDVHPRGKVVLTVYFFIISRKMHMM